MEKIVSPQNVNFKKSKEPNRGSIIIEPLYPGYGMTLGNALRRVLLSSLTGAAAVGVKIKGVDHEFTTLPHVKEDILEIILNLKKLCLKIFSEEEVKLELDVHGKKEVKAADITANSQVEIVNPDLVLANITDMAGSLSMEIYADKGRGYRPVESIDNKKNELGYIEMDSIFSPVLAVGIKVDNVRVGKTTNWNKLTLDVTTDGTITFAEAFEQAVKILIEQFGSFLGQSAGESSAPAADKQAAQEEAAPAEAEEVKPAEKKVSTDKEESGAEEKPKKKRGRPKKE